MSFSQSQAHAFLDRIKLPQRTREQLKEPGGGQYGLEALTSITQHMATNVVFENSFFHYTTSRSCELDSKLLYEKIVERKEGGVCLQVTQTLMRVLRALGFQCFLVFARVNVNASAGARAGAQGVVYSEWIHLVLIATINGERYLVDPFFGPRQPISPILLRHNQPEPDMPNRERRLVWSNIAQNADRDQRYWILQFRPSSGDGAKRGSGEWTDIYCFREDEWFVSDIDTVVRATLPTLSHWIWQKVFAFKWLPDEAGRLVGWVLLLDNIVKRNWKGREAIIQTLNSEQDRAEALAKHFDVHVDSDDIENISSTMAALKPISPQPNSAQEASASPPSHGGSAVSKSAGDRHEMLLSKL